VMDFFLSSEGWDLYKAYLQAEFDLCYKKLRKSPRDSSFYKLHGKLDVLEYAIELPQIIIARAED